MKIDLFKNINEYLKEKKLLESNLRNILIKSFLGIVLVVLIVSLMPSERPFEYSNLKVGSVSKEEIIAPFTFPIIKSPDVLKEERYRASLNVPPVFDYMEDIQNVQLIKLENLFSEMSDFFNKTLSHKKNQKISGNSIDYLTNVDSLMQQFTVKYNVSLSVDDFNFLLKNYLSKQHDKFREDISTGFIQIYKQGIISRSKKEVEEKKIVILKSGFEEETELSEVLDVIEAEDLLENYFKNKYPMNPQKSGIATLLIPAFLSPNLIYDADLTESRKQKAVKEVPTTRGFVYENQRIVDSHDYITEEIYRKLQSLGAAQAERSISKRGWARFLFYIGKYIFAVIIVLMIGLYLVFYRPKLFADNKMLVLIVVVFLFQFLLAALMENVLDWNYLSIPITLGPMLFAMLIDASIAFSGTIIISIILGVSAGNNFHLALMTLIVGTIALFSVQKIRNRGQMFHAILYILAGYAVINFSYGFIHYESFKIMVKNFTFYMLPNAILVPTAVFLLNGLFEKIFDVTTDTTLLELSDLNHPLLKRLSVEAPGTFHHSIIVGNLAEAASEEIGANSLLARVGCYYHDIGKMQRAEYFVENQAGETNKHEGLAPTMSALIISKHVRAGLELAEEFKLPLAVKQFIPEHHGTSIMAYFLHKAEETMEPKDINETDFRYPGPKPQSKETAIAMLADNVEAAARTLPNPNLQRISSLVDNLIEKRFQEGELDECDLTLRELNKIKEAFVRVLMGIHHLRIEYPKEAMDDKQKKSVQKTSLKTKGKVKNIENETKVTQITNSNPSQNSKNDQEQK